MQFTENIVYRVREWRDRKDDEPDLAVRMRRLWQQQGDVPARPSAPPLRRRLFALRAAGSIR